jgi:hypothetical protein
MTTDFHILRLAVQPPGYPHALGTLAVATKDGAWLLAGDIVTSINEDERHPEHGRLWDQVATVTADDIAVLRNLAATCGSVQGRAAWNAITGARAVPGLGYAVDILGNLRRLERELADLRATAYGYGLTKVP